MLPRNTIQTEYKFLIAEQIKYSDEVFFSDSIAERNKPRQHEIEDI